MVQRPQRHQGLDATAVTPGRTVPPRLLMCYQYLVHRYMLCLPGVGGAFCVLQIQTHLFQLLVIALQIGFLKTPIAALQRWTCWLLLLRWQTFHNSSSQRYIFFISVLSLPLFLNSHWLTPALLLRGLTITEITARGAVLLHQASLAVTIAPASPGRTDK